MTILVIVESPGKIKKISSILGPQYNVMASVGHIRNLDPKDLGVDVNNNFKPNYIIIPDKKKVVRNLKFAVNEADDVILAADEDREGEAIAAALADVLKLKDPKRIVFNSITKKAIKDALKNPRKIDQKMVDAQKTRMILDKIVGYRLSPLLWENVAHKLSAGRVQSVVVKLIIDKENEILDHNSSNYYKIIGTFNDIKYTLHKLIKKTEKELKGMPYKFKGDVNKLLNDFIKCKFTVYCVKKKTSNRNPPPPYITSSLQQDASSKLGFSPKTTMSVAQKLYENGHITYMRTDSTNLSKEALNACKSYVIDKYGNEYYKLRIYKSKSKNAQEAHEAIRPTHIDRLSVSGNEPQKRLYNLIWKRTVASQMSATKVDIKIIQLDNDQKLDNYFESKIEKITFLGYLILYNVKLEDEDKVIPKKGNELKYQEIIATEEFSKATSRYTEASLVKELEKRGIGRPSTFANIIGKIQDKQYIEKKNIDGLKKEIKIYKLKRDNITENKKEIMLGKEKNKLVPTDIGKQVNEYLNTNFVNVMDYKFTANMENNLDKIANGKMNWLTLLNSFYNPFNDKFNALKGNTLKIQSEIRELGKDPKSGFMICATKTKFGHAIKILDGTKKGKYISIDKPLKSETITLKQALKLMEFPKELGKIDNSTVYICKGKFGLYLKCNRKNYSINKMVNLEEAKEIINQKKSNNIKEFEINKKKYEIKKGKYGPYISFDFKKKKKFIGIPKNINPEKITKKQVKELISKKV